MKHLIIYSHPNPESFNHAILETFTAGLRKKGHEVRVRDLYELGFDPVLSASDFELLGKGLASADVKREQDEVRWADFITFIFPCWWAAMPAITRGYIDRVFSSGFAYIDDEKGLRGLLGGKKAFYFCTLGAPSEVYEKFGIFKSMAQTIDESIFKFCGLALVGSKYFGSVPKVTQAQRKAMLEEVRKIAETIG